MKKQINIKFSAYLPIVVSICLIAATGCTKFEDELETSKAAVVSSKIVYTDINPDSVILKTNSSSFGLDLNNDGINDFMFNATKKICGDGLIAPIVSDIYFSIVPASGGNAMMTDKTDMAGGLSLLPALNASVAIGKDSVWITTPQYLLDGAAASGYIRCMMAHGNWLNVSDKYIGLKFMKGTNTYFGWARLSSSYSATAAPYRHLTSGQLIIKDYAYNSNPNQPILAAQTK